MNSPLLCPVRYAKSTDKFSVQFRRFIEAISVPQILPINSVYLDFILSFLKSCLIVIYKSWYECIEKDWTKLDLGTDMRLEMKAFDDFK